MRIFYSLSFLAQASKYLMQKNRALHLQSTQICVQWREVTCQCPIYLEQLEYNKNWGQQNMWMVIAFIIPTALHCWQNHLVLDEERSSAWLVTSKHTHVSVSAGIDTKNAVQRSCLPSQQVQMEPTRTSGGGFRHVPPACTSGFVCSVFWWETLPMPCSAGGGGVATTVRPPTSTSPALPQAGLCYHQAEPLIEPFIVQSVSFPWLF